MFELFESKIAQYSMEFFLIISFSFLLIIPVMILFLTQTQDIQDDVTGSQVNKFADELISAVNTVYYFGEPSRKTLEVYLPKFVKGIAFNGTMLSISVDTGEISYNVTKFSAVNMSGNVSSNTGRHIIKVSSQANGVIITE